MLHVVLYKLYAVLYVPLGCTGKYISSERFFFLSSKERALVRCSVLRLVVFQKKKQKKKNLLVILSLDMQNWRIQNMSSFM